MNGSTTMEGYLWKKGHALPIMQRRYCVLKGTMLAYYTDADDFARALTPRNVLEVVGVRELRDSGGGGFLSPSKRRPHAFEVEYLGGTTYTCCADSREEKQQWLATLQHALDEPDRIVQDEIEDAQRHLKDEAAREETALAAAGDAVAKAQQLADDALAMDAAIKRAKSERAELDERLAHAKILLAEAGRAMEKTTQALANARAKAHESALAIREEEEESKDDGDAIGDRIARLAAQLEVDETHEATQTRLIVALEQEIEANARRMDEFKARAMQCAGDGRRLRDAAAASLQSAHSAKQLSRLRVSSWTASSSHLDPLAEGYLLCRHPIKPSMHRRYYVLYGNTLCWYKDVDDYNQHVTTPSGVVHVASVGEWAGKVGGMKTFPHAFAVATVEGKTLFCSAPVRQSAVTWETALHIGLTMPALSPHRAMHAKARRDSFDLLTVATAPSSQPLGPMQRRASLAHIAASESSVKTETNKPTTESAEETKVSSQAERDEDTPVVEGYLVKKSSLFPVMKKKYCVLRKLTFDIFDSHEQAAAWQPSQTLGDHEQVLVCGVSDWDGHGALLQYHHGFQVHTVKHQTIQCSAANENEKAKWVTGVHEALLRFKDQLLATPTLQEEHVLEQARAAIVASLEPTAEKGSDSLEAAKAQFNARIQQVYVEYHPTKVHDVPMLVDKYTGREATLVAHLDRIYGTQLTLDMEMRELVERLESEAKTSSQDRRRRASSGVASGLQDFAKMAGYLKWTPTNSATHQAAPRSPVSPSFTVLSVDKLLRYPSETAYSTEPYSPSDVVQLLRVSDHGATTPLSFLVSCRCVDAETKPPSRPSSPSSPPASSHNTLTFLLEAPSEELKTLWMAKMRSGLGVAAAAQSPTKKLATAAAAVAGPAEPGVEPQETNGVQFRRKLIEYYRRNNPRRLAEVDTLLHYFAGRERQLLADLDATFSTSISSDPEFLQVLPSAVTSPSRDANAATDSDGDSDGDGAALQYESYVWVKHPLLGAGFRKCYCVLHDTTWSCFENSHDAHAFGSSGGPERSSSPPPSVLLSDAVVNLNYLNAKLHEMRVLSFEGHEHGAVLLRADVEPIFYNWTRALRQAADLQQQLESESGDPLPADVKPLHDKLVSFYQQHAPDKAREVAVLLRSFQGRERSLIEEIDRVYSTQIAQDAEFLALLPASCTPLDEAADAVETSDESAAGSSILMEGYLVKRGHLVPSMRKRYCVLVKNVLTYFLTHEDSRNAETQPLGSFRVEIVSDWHGKTATQTYEHGMELETHDGKTFFCAAFASDDKTQWMRAFHHGIAVARAEEASAKSDGDVAAEETDDVRAKRLQLRERLVAYYQQHNPRKLSDLDLLLACYKGREIAMLEAMDVAYGTSLLHDASLLTLLPPLNAHTQALRTLEYDGPLERAAGGNSDAAWKHVKSVYVAQSALTLTFYASREGFKAGAAALTSAADRAVTVLAVKALDHTCRFAVETTDHIWMHFQAPNALEKTHWMQLLQAALDATLASAVLEEERSFLSQFGAKQDGRGRVRIQGFLMIRMDFQQALADFQRQLQQQQQQQMPAAIVEAKAQSASTNKKSSKDGLTLEIDASSSSAMVECYAVLRGNNELALFASDDRRSAIATLTALSTQAWKAVGGLSPTSSNSSTVGKFPFQILTQEQVVLSCGAATDLERAKWIQQVRAGAQQAAALEMLQEQREDHEAQASARVRQSAVDVDTGDLRGYLNYRLDGEDREGFVVASSRARLQIFTDESAFLRRERAVLEAQAVELETDAAAGETVEVTSPGGHMTKLFRALGKSPKQSPRDPLLFRVQIDVDAETTEAMESTGRKKKAPPLAVCFVPASADEKTRWTEAILSGINVLKGEQLLRDEKLVLAIEQTHGADTATEETGEDAPFVRATSAMEGALTPWHEGRSADTVFAILSGCRLTGYASRDAAMASSKDDACKPSLELQVGTIADWSPPSESDKTSGFQVFSHGKHTLFFTAPTADARRRWVHAVQHELDFALAETYLDEDAKAFARLAAAHVAAAHADHASAEAADMTAATASRGERHEGYARVRHQFVESMWRERFVVAVGASLWIFKDGGDACADDWQRRALECHELIAVNDGPVAAAAASTGSGGYRHGLRLENQDGAALELTFAADADRVAWRRAIQEAVATQQAGAASSRSISRDAALPFVPGAAMEGYLKVRERQTRSRAALRLLTAAVAASRWKTRYAVLIGAQWLLYETQQQALALHGHNQSADAGGAIRNEAAEQEQQDDRGDVLPQAVLEVAAAEAWPAGQAKDEDELATHGFVVVGCKTSAFGAASPSSAARDAKAVGDVLECKARTSLERKRWLNAMEDAVAMAAREQQMVRDAMAQHEQKAAGQQHVKDKVRSLQDAAQRQSAFLQDVLDSIQAPLSSSSSEEDEDDGSTSDEDDGEEDSGDALRPRLSVRTRSMGRIHSPENSPMYRLACPDREARRASQTGTVFGEDAAYDVLGSPSKGGKSTAGSSPWWSLQAVFACCFDRPPAARKTATAAIVPLKNAKYVYESYHEDTPSRLDEW